MRRTVEKRERAREREGRQGRGGEQKEAFPIAVRQLTVPCLVLSDKCTLFQALELVLGDILMLRPPQLMGSPLHYL